MKFANAAGELANTGEPKSAIRALIFGSARATLISLLSLSTISVGVLLGVPTPIAGGSCAMAGAKKIK
jgi:hypothetical protein